MEKRAERYRYFFLSYSHTDRDEYLNRFFDDLRWRVTRKAGEASINPDHPEVQRKLDEKIGFRDHEGVKTGQDWMDKIADALQDSAVLVCLYTPSFFSKDEKDHFCFCAREIAAFLKRDGSIRYARGIGEKKDQFQLKGARNILPIMWASLRDLQRKNYPPYVLHRIAWKIEVKPALATLYLEAGLGAIAKRRTKNYQDILDHFAGCIVDLAENPPPCLDEKPDFATLHNLFWHSPEAHEIDPGASPVEIPGATAVPPTGGPGMVLAIEVRHKQAEWFPYVGEASIRSLIDEITSKNKLFAVWRTFDPQANDFGKEIKNALRDAEQNNMSPMLLVDPHCLSSESSFRALFELLHQPVRAGFVVPADGTGRDALRFIVQHGARLQAAGNGAGWIVRITKQKVRDLEVAVTSVAIDILSRMASPTGGQVHQLPDNNPGPDVRPQVSNV